MNTEAPVNWEAAIIVGAFVLFVLCLGLGAVTCGEESAARHRARATSQIAAALAPCGTADVEAGTFALKKGYRVVNLHRSRFTVAGPNGAVCTVEWWSPSTVVPEAP